MVRSALELEPCKDADRPRGNETPVKGASSSKRSRSSCHENEDDLLPNLKPRKGTELRFTAFPELAYPVGSSPSEITKHSLDSSYVFEQFVTSYKE